MKRTLALLLTVALFLLVTAHRLPAPIQEVQESPTPTPQQSATPKARVTTTTSTPAARTSTAKSKTSAKTESQTKVAKNRFAGTWAGVTHTFPWGDISQTITIDATETMMTMSPSNGPDGGKPKAARIERQSASELKADFGNRGSYTLTLLADGSTMLVRLQAPFNDNTAPYHRTATSQ